MVIVMGLGRDVKGDLERASPFVWGWLWLCYVIYNLSSIWLMQ